MHRVDTGDFNYIGLMFRHHICSSHFTDTSRGGPMKQEDKENFIMMCINVASDLKSRKRHL